MRYRITRKDRKGYFLTGFFPNSGGETKTVFAFSKYSWFTFTSEAEAQKYLVELQNECEKQRARWKEWTETALQVIKHLEIESYEEVQDV